MILHHHARCLVRDKVFWSLTPFLFEGSKNTSLLFHNWIFSKTVSITFATDFCETCPRKKYWITNSTLLKKIKPKITVERTKSFPVKPVVFQKTFWTLYAKTKKFPSVYILSCLKRSFEWKWSKQFPCRLALSLGKLRMLKRNIRGSQRICFFVDWGL